MHGVQLIGGLQPKPTGDDRFAVGLVVLTHRKRQLLYDGEQPPAGGFGDHGGRVHAGEEAQVHPELRLEVHGGQQRDQADVRHHEGTCVSSLLISRRIRAIRR